MTLLERIQTALGAPLLREIRATGLYGYESGDAVCFDIRPAPCGARHIFIKWNEETDLYHVRLYRHSGARSIQGQAGVTLADLGSVVRRLSNHG